MFGRGRNCGHGLACLERRRIAFPRTCRCIISYIAGVVLIRSTCIAGVAGALERQTAIAAVVALRAVGPRTHEELECSESGQSQQRDHQHIAESGTHSQRMRQPGQAQASSQATEHACPGTLGCCCGGGRCSSSGFCSRRVLGCSLCRCPGRCVILGHAGRLATDRSTPAHACCFGSHTAQQQSRGHQ